MLIENKLRKEVTPRRVYAVLKLINAYDGKIKIENVYTLIQPQNLIENDSEIRKVVKFLLEEKLIKEDSLGNLNIEIEKQYLKSIKEFREYISQNIFSNMESESLFFRVTKEILSKDKDFYDTKGFENIALTLETNVDKEFILAWRFWAEFIGWGKILNEQFLINPYIRISDRILNNENKGDFIVSKFLTILKEECPEFKETISENNINLALSISLRILEKIGKIKLVNIKDSLETWKLYYSAIDSMEFTNIIVLGEENK